jgi:hypothetical protein
VTGNQAKTRGEGKESGDGLDDDETGEGWDDETATLDEVEPPPAGRRDEPPKSP